MYCNIKQDKTWGLPAEISNTTMATPVTLPASLIYPVEVTQLLKQQGEQVKKRDVLLKYKYWNLVPDGVVEEGAPPPDMVRKEFYASFESPLDGNLVKFDVTPGDRLNDDRAPICSIQEPCSHSVQYGGLCAICGASLDGQDYTGWSDTDRAPIAMTHDTSGLTVSRTEAERIENTTTKRLISERKLILVVDLDQTVIHAAVDPEIGEWMRDPESPNHEACKEVKTFVLREPASPAANASGRPRGSEQGRNCTYYVKLRPGLSEFLTRVSPYYEMHIYTMATRAYAAEVASQIDPDGRFFGNRILTREESGSLQQKSLQRLFPVTTRLVAVIDDRGDVWGWDPHLLRVFPYHFFTGTGDINSGFLPHRQGVVEENGAGEDEGPPSEHGDKELAALSDRLLELHKEFFDHPETSDVATLLPVLKSRVFDGCVFLFSGIFPIGTPLDSADIVLWVRQFGAVVLADFVPSVTHVIAKDGRTMKARQAAGASIPVVRLEWLLNCLHKWEKVPTKYYEIKVVDPLEPQSTPPPETGENPQGDIAEGFVRSLSRGEVDWDEMNEELKEFMPETDDEDAIESEEEDALPSESRKRARESDDEDVARNEPSKKPGVEPQTSDDEWIVELEQSME